MSLQNWLHLTELSKYIAFDRTWDLFGSANKGLFKKTKKQLQHLSVVKLHAQYANGEVKIWGWNHKYF